MELGILRSKVFKILPMYEEGLDWHRQLRMTVIELNGLHRLVRDPNIFSIICILHGVPLDIDRKTLRGVILKCTRILSDVEINL